MAKLRPQDERPERRLAGSPSRTFWRSFDMGIVDEPMLWAMLKYRQKKNRVRVPKEEANLISSLTGAGKHLPVLDLDFPHRYVPSTTPGHGHLYLDAEELPRWRWWALMAGLYLGKQIEMGFFAWSLRRGANFVRTEEVKKSEGSESGKYTYGWLFKRKEQ